MIPKVKRIVDREAVNAARLTYCEYCGKTGIIHVHHLKSKGSGGHDTPDNLISLCIFCHSKAHTGEISREQLREAKRWEGNNAN